MQENIGANIARLRREHNMKQDELAEMLDVTPQAVSKWENGASMPDIALLPKLANIFGVTIDCSARTVRRNRTCRWFLRKSANRSMK